MFQSQFFTFLALNVCKTLDFWCQKFFNKIYCSECLRTVPVSFLKKEMFTLIHAHINANIFLHHTPEYHVLSQEEYLILSTGAITGGNVPFFSFSDANQLLIILTHIDLLPRFLPYGLMSDIIRRTISCLERNGLMHYSRHINTGTFIWNFERSQKEARRRHTI